MSKSITGVVVEVLPHGFVLRLDPPGEGARTILTQLGGRLLPLVAGDHVEAVGGYDPTAGEKWLATKAFKLLQDGSQHQIPVNDDEHPMALGVVSAVLDEGFKVRLCPPFHGKRIVRTALPGKSLRLEVDDLVQLHVASWDERVWDAGPIIYKLPGDGTRIEMRVDESRLADGSAEPVSVKPLDVQGKDLRRVFAQVRELAEHGATLRLLPPFHGQKFVTIDKPERELSIGDFVQIVAPGPDAADWPRGKLYKFADDGQRLPVATSLQAEVAQGKSTRHVERDPADSDTAKAVFSFWSESENSPAKGPGLGGGYVVDPGKADGPGLGGGYVARPNKVDGPGLGGGYVVDPGKADGPGLGGGYIVDPNKGPGLGGGYIFTPNRVDGPGLGGGYVVDPSKGPGGSGDPAGGPPADGPGLGGGYRPHPVAAGASTAEGPGLGGGYVALPQKGPGLGGGYDPAPGAGDVPVPDGPGLGGGYTPGSAGVPPKAAEAGVLAVVIGILDQGFKVRLAPPLHGERVIKTTLPGKKLRLEIADFVVVETPQTSLQGWDPRCIYKILADGTKDKLHTGATSAGEEPKRGWKLF